MTWTYHHSSNRKSMFFTNRISLIIAIKLKIQDNAFSEVIKIIETPMITLITG